MLTETEILLISLIEKEDFITEEIINEIGKKLKMEGKSVDTFLLRKFIIAKCPNCGTKGWFKLYPFGRCQHPECNWFWYISPLRYLGLQVVKAFTRSAGYAEKEIERDKKSGERGCFWLALTAIFSFAFAIGFLLPVAIISTLIQMIFYFTQKKPEVKEVK